MEDEYYLETLRSGIDTFDRNFADYLICRRREGSTVKKCTFFRDDERMKKWAACYFERRS